MGAVSTPHPDNYVFLKSQGKGRGRVGRSRVQWQVSRYLSDAFQLTVSGRLWSDSISDLQTPELERDAGLAELEPDLSRFRLDYRGKNLLQGHPAGFFGVCGASWLLRFRTHGDEQFFGMGEKWGPLAKTGLRTSFYNTDVWAQFDRAAIREGRADPMYGSVPYVIVERAGYYCGILVDSPGRVCMQIPGKDAKHASSRDLVLGADYTPRIHFLVGPSLAELTCKLQRLVGVTPRPPLWALGHHQCRWGYRGAADLLELDAEFTRHEFPCDGLWLDIDYMDGFRVFTTSRQHLPRPRVTLQKLQAKGRRVVAIIDPGVKREPGYRVYDEGLRGGHFCVTPERQPFVGLVWPGETVFPDFAETRVQRWWAGEIGKFAELGFAGFWLDMNEPACGPVDSRSMLFASGSLPHDAYHNRYALGMAQASYAGLLQHNQRLRPFLLSRAHSQGISRYAAVWTGDNYSNERHLQQSIATSLNMSLSGVPFNGPDVPGFGGDADEDLLVRWYKVAFLFPFLRNHACTGTRSQEPWAFSKTALHRVRHFVRLRYKLLPYLYSLFVRQERFGEPLLRPLFYSGGIRVQRALFAAQDQFFVGPALMQAPLVSRSLKQRRVLLPAGNWYAAHTGRWLQGARTLMEREQRDSTPLYIREGQMVPMLMGLPKDNHTRLDQIEVHVFLRKRSKLTATLDYECDDGLTFDYRKGKVSRFKLRAWVQGGELRVLVSDVRLDYQPLRFRLVLYSDFTRVHFEGAVGKHTYQPRPASFRFSGIKLKLRMTPSLVLG